MQELYSLKIKLIRRSSEMDAMVIFLLLTSVFFNCNINSVQVTAIKGLEEKCLKEMGLNSDVYNRAVQENFKDADMKIKCTTKCVIEGHNVMRKNGTIDVNVAAELMFAGEDSIKRGSKIIESCIKTGDNDCDTAHYMMLCINKKVADLMDEKNKGGNSKKQP